MTGAWEGLEGKLKTSANGTWDFPVWEHSHGLEMEVAEELLMQAALFQGKKKEWGKPPP